MTRTGSRQHLRLAEQLGGETTTIPGQNVAQDIIRHATANNFTHIVIGKPTSRDGASSSKGRSPTI